MASMDELILLKLGGSLITEKTVAHTARTKVIGRIAEEIKKAMQIDPDRQILIGHGSGSFGHIAAHKYCTRDGVKTDVDWLGFAEVWREAKALNQIVMESLIEAGLPVIAFPPCAQVLTRSHKIITWNISQIRASLEHGLIPVIYGDVVFDEAIGGTILSTEEQFEYLAGLLHPTRILLAGIEKGIWNDFPRRTELLERITPVNTQQFSAHLAASESPDVTGGMRSKVMSMLELVQAGHCREVCIFSGLEDQSILNALAGECAGTMISFD